MKTERENMRGKQGPSIRQATIVLPYFGEEVPVLYLSDGKAYLPVRALCRMLGLRAETHIPRWRKLVLWTNARKLPLQTSRAQRIVWCLNMGALPFWCVCFNWSLVAPARHEQLRKATKEWQKDVAQAQRLLLDRYRALRRYLFAFLGSYSDAETWPDHWSPHFSCSHEVASFLRLEQLLSRGKTLIGEATAQARKMVLEQAMAPVVDMITLDVDGAGTEIATLPLFPVVPREDCERFFASMRKLTQWYREMATFIDKLKSSQNRDQSEEA